MLPGVLPGVTRSVTRSVTRCYQECYQVLPPSGVTSSIRFLLQNYLDATSDVQTVCLALTLAQKYNPCWEEEEEDGVLESYLQFYDMRCCSVVVLWCCGVVVLWCCSVVVL